MDLNLKNKPITYRLANISDAPNIADLHIKNWQKFYRGMWTDNFLDNLAPKKQLDHWTKILSEPNEKQHLLVAEADSKLVGFAFTRLDNDPVWGSLLDNLHVRENMQGFGIGQKLIKTSADWVLSKNPKSDYYLWVLEGNLKTRDFYKKSGATEPETTTEVDPEIGTFRLVRCFWKGAKIKSKT